MTTIPFGQELTASQFQAVTSGWGGAGPAKLAALGDCVIGWEAYSCGSIPQLTGRIFVKDQGIDGKVILTSEEARRLPGSSLLRDGLNWLQYKWKANLDIRALAKELRGAWRAASEKAGCEPKRFIVVSNLDLTQNRAGRTSKSEKDRLREAILEGSSSTGDVHILSAAELTAYCNAKNALLAGFFWDNSGIALELYRRRHFQEYGLPESAVFAGREEERENLYRHLSQAGRVAVLYGPQGRGKSRLAIETLNTWWRNSLVLEESSGLSPSILARLQPSDPLVVLVEEPPPSELEAWLRAALRSQARVVVTQRTPRSLSIGEFASDGRVLEFSLQPLGPSNCIEVVNQLGSRLDPPTKFWLTHQCQGSLGALALATRPYNVASSSIKDWRIILGQEYLKDAQQALDSPALRWLHILSLFPRLRLNDEALQVGHILGQTGSPPVRELEASGWLRVEGSSGWVSPPVLADLLMAKELERSAGAVEKLMAELPKNLMFSFLERLASCPDRPEWDSWLGNSGWFQDLASLERRGRLLPLSARTRPSLIMAALDRLLAPLTHDELLRVGGDVRRNIVWSLDYLLSVEETAGPALTLISRLAAAKNETYSNQATAVLASALRPISPQNSLALDNRFKWLKSLFSNEPFEVKKSVLEALLHALQFPSLGVILQAPTYEPGQWSYAAQRAGYEAIIDSYIWLLSQFGSVISNLLEGSQFSIFLRSARLYAELLTPDTTSTLLKFLSARVTAECQEGPLVQELLKSLSGRPLREADQSLVNGISAVLDGQSPLERLLSNSASASGHDFDLNESETALLKATLNDLPVPFVKKLLNGQGRAPAVMAALGRLDRHRQLLSLMLEEISRRDIPPLNLLSVYLAQASDPLHAWPEIEKRLPEPAHQIELLSRLTATATGVEKLTSLLNQYPQFGESVLNWLRPRGWENVEASEFRHFLLAVAGPDQQDYPLALRVAHEALSPVHATDKSLSDLLASWLMKGIAPIPGDEWDWVAAHVTAHFPQSGLALLGAILESPSTSLSWSPLSGHHLNSFLTRLFTYNVSETLDVIYRAFQRWPQDERPLIPFELQSSLLMEKFSRGALHWATRTPDHALFLGQVLGSTAEGVEKSEFWKALSELLVAFPPPGEVSEAIQKTLLHSLRSRAGMDDLYRKHLVDSLSAGRAQGKLPGGWVDETIEKLSVLCVPPIVWEYQIDSNEFLDLLKDPTSPDRRWVLTRILRELPWAQARKYISLKELKELLPEVSLPFKKRRSLEAALEFWSESA